MTDDGSRALRQFLACVREHAGDMRHGPNPSSVIASLANRSKRFARRNCTTRG